MDLSARPRSGRGELLAAAGLALVLACSALLRWRLLDVPLERDEGEYAYAGQLLLAGRAPYLQLYNMKLPGIYLVYAGILALFGESVRGIHLGLLAASLASTALVFLLGRRLLAGRAEAPAAALGAAALFALLSAGGEVLGPWANAEHFVTPFALLGLLWCAGGPAPGARARAVRYLGAGAALALAVLVKQHAAAFALCGAAWILVASGALRAGARRESARRLALLLLGGSMPFALVVCWLAFAGALGRAFFWCVTYAREYVDQMPLELAPLALRHNATPIVSAAPFAWVLGGLGLVLVLARVREQGERLLALLAFCSFLAIVPGFFFRQHYFLLLLPVLCLLAGRSLAAAAAFAPGRARDGGRAASARVVCLVLLLAALADAAWRGRKPYFLWTPEQTSRLVYAYNPFADSPAIGALVAQLCPPDGTVAILGSEPQILFYARRRSATGYVYMYALMEGHEHAPRMQRELIAEVEAARPEVLVQVNVPGSWLFRPGISRTEILRWSQEFSRGYELVAAWELGLEGSIRRSGAQLAELTGRPQLSVEVLRRRRGADGAR